MIQVRSATPADAPAWLRMRQALWPEYGSNWHAGEVQQYFAGKLGMPLEVLLAAPGRGGVPWWPPPNHGRLPRDVLNSGSDALIDNETSAAAHRALGFVETVQIRCFRKSLD